jgi:beta-lactamase regulating signal transducer with metallopeptidase domain
MTEVVSYALLCGFALSAVLVPLTAFALRRATRLGGATRHTIWFMVLVTTVAATVAAFVVSAVRPAQQLSDVVVLPAVPAGVHAADLPLAALGTTFVACWLVFSLARLFGIARRIAAMRAVKRRAVPIGFGGELPRGARTLASESGVPGAVGFFHPAILLPADTMRDLDPDDARRIVLHEAAHLRRGDDVTGLVFLLCAAVFWLNPFVHYIGKKLSLECEIACDELVVERTGDAARYAALLFEMAENMTERDPRLAWNGFAHRNGLVTRIHNLLLRPTARRRALSSPALALLGAVLLSGAGLAAFNAPALAHAEDGATQRVNPFVHGDRATQFYPATRSFQKVRVFSVCKASHMPNDGRIHNDTKFCEYPSGRFIPWKSWTTTRIKKKGATP